MTADGYTHIAIIADRTGSTGRATDPGRTRAMDFTEGIKQIIREHSAAPGKVTFSLVQFSSMGCDRIAWFTTGDDHALATWSIVPYGGAPHCWTR